MSVETEASKAIDSAKKHIKQASKNLLVVMDIDTVGRDDFSNMYIEEVCQFAHNLIKMYGEL